MVSVDVKPTASFHDTETKQTGERDFGWSQVKRHHQAAIASAVWQQELQEQNTSSKSDTAFFGIHSVMVCRARSVDRTVKNRTDRLQPLTRLLEIQLE